MKYCKGCQHYIPIARYQFEMKDPKMRKCKHYSICNRIRKLVEKEQSQQLVFLTSRTSQVLGVSKVIYVN